jgi:hypothetical protein
VNLKALHAFETRESNRLPEEFWGDSGRRPTQELLGRVWEHYSLPARNAAYAVLLARHDHKCLLFSLLPRDLVKLIAKAVLETKGDSAWINVHIVAKKSGS